MEKQELRSGFTTGTCAAAAAKAAAAMLLTGNPLLHMKLVTPKGTEADLPLFHVVLEKDQATCAVQKDAGDDPDVTDKAMIFARVQYFEGDEAEAKKTCYCNCGEQEESSFLFLTAGEGIGWVTKPGLSCPIGLPAINPVPRAMIFQGVEEARREAGFEGPLMITVSMPEGKKLAEKTFNSKLGIVGGLSILGTTGIVNPMSEEALTATIRLELHMKAVAGERKVILTPGNYGEAFIKETLSLSMSEGVTCSNFIGESFLMASEDRFKDILFVGHIGKLIKVAGGVYNTHSKHGDRRMEILWGCASDVIQTSEDLKQQILSANTTEEAAKILEDHNILEPVMTEVVHRIKKQVTEWSGGIHVEVVTFSTTYGILGMSEGAKDLIKTFTKRNDDRE